MNDLELLDLVDRYTYLSKKYGDLALDLAPKLEQFGKYRKELQFILEQMKKKGLDPQDSEKIKELLEQELQKMSASKQESLNEPPPNTQERNT